MKRYLIILCLILIGSKSFGAYATNTYPVYNIVVEADPFYGKFKSKLLKLVKFTPGTNSLNTFITSETAFPFKAKGLRDLNGDSFLDIINQTGKVIRVAYGPNFSTVSNFNAPLAESGFKIVATGDIDGDEDIDLILQKGKKVIAYLANEGFYQQAQLQLGNSLAPRAKILGAIDQDAKFVENQTEDQVSFKSTNNNTFFVATMLNTVAKPDNNPDLIVKVGKELFRYTNSNGSFFPTELPFYTLQRKEKFVGIFNTGLSPKISGVSITTKIIVEPVEPGDAPRNQNTIISNTIAIPDIIIQKGRSVSALSFINNFSSPILIASNKAGVKIIGPK